MDHLSKLKIELKNLLGEGLDIALKHIGEKMSPDSPKYNEYVQQKSRYAAYLSAIMMGGSSKAELDQVYNAISAISTEKGYGAVFDKSSGFGLMFSDARYDISDEVLIRLGYKK